MASGVTASWLRTSTAPRRTPRRSPTLFATLVRTAGLPPIRLHDLRHSYATAALAAGVPVKVLSQRIGHADVGVTLAVYAHLMPGDDEDAARRVDALFAEPWSEPDYQPLEQGSDQQRGGGGRESNPPDGGRPSQPL
jgi:hypothetical protein